MMVCLDTINEWNGRDYGPLDKHKKPLNSSNFISFSYSKRVDRFFLYKIQDNMYKNKIATKDVKLVDNRLLKSDFYNLKKKLPWTNKYTCYALAIIGILASIGIMISAISVGGALLGLILILTLIYYLYYRFKVYNKVIENLEKRERDFQKIVSEINHTEFLNRPITAIIGKYGAYFGFKLAINPTDKPNISTFDAWKQSRPDYNFDVGNLSENLGKFSFNKFRE